MASISLSNHLLCVYSSKRINQSPNKSQSHRRHLTCSVRLRTAAKSSPRKDATTSVESSPESQTSKRLNRPEPNRSNLPDYLSLSISRLRDGLNIDDLGMDILSIALPAALALAADPITSLIDTAFVGHLGSVELAAVGVSVSVFNLVSKLFNVPLLNITTSFVAEEQTLQGQGSDQIANDEDVKQQGKKQLPSVSASLSLAAGLGVAEAIALSVGSGSLMNIMGIPADSPMRAPAESFLTLRAFGAPPIVIALAIQGAFRGLKDTKTPLYAIGKY